MTFCRARISGVGFNFHGSNFIQSTHFHTHFSPFAEVLGNRNGALGAMLARIRRDGPILLKGAGTRKRRLLNTVGRIEIVANTIDNCRTKLFTALGRIVASAILDNVVFNFIAETTGNVPLVVIAPAIDTDILHVVVGTPFHFKFGGNITHILYGNSGVSPPTLSGTGQHIDSATPFNGKSTTIFGAWVKRHSCVTGTILAPEFVIIACAATKLLGRAIRAV